MKAKKRSRSAAFALFYGSVELLFERPARLLDGCTITTIKRCYQESRKVTYIAQK
jgi:hypothetical protein